MTKIISGNTIANNILNNIKTDLINYNVKPKLGIIILGDNPASLLYIKKKREAATKIGINIVIKNLDISCSEQTIINAIEIMNNDKLINGIIVQLPLPPTLNEEKILNTISYYKDVDGFHTKNIGNLALNNRNPLFIPCTALSCLHIFETLNIDLKGKNIVIIGKSNIVGLPLMLALLKKDATVTVCHIETLNIKEHTKCADILISACGNPEMIKKDWIKDDAIIIDVGINYISDNSDPSKRKLVGDVDINDVKEKVSYITPVPYGIGPITVAILMSNTFKAFKLQNS